jgi:hypothetical protein
VREGTTSRVMASDRPYVEFLQRQSGIFWILPSIFKRYFLISYKILNIPMLVSSSSIRVVGSLLRVVTSFVVYVFPGIN